VAPSRTIQAVNLVVVSTALLATSCSGSSRDSRQTGSRPPITTLQTGVVARKGTFTDPLYGTSFHYPPSWFVTGFTHTVFPRRIVVASYRVVRAQVEGDCGGMRALNALPPRGVAVLLIDYGPTTTFPRPPQGFAFRHSAYTNYECFGPSYRYRFRAAGHDWQVHVAVGPLAAPALRHKALAILDSLAYPSG
jgi:hypothetical protein